MQTIVFLGQIFTPGHYIIPDHIFQYYLHPSIHNKTVCRQDFALLTLRFTYFASGYECHLMKRKKERKITLN